MFTSFHIGDQINQFDIAQQIADNIVDDSNQLVLVDWGNDGIIRKITNCLSLFNVKTHDTPPIYYGGGFGVIVEKNRHQQNVYFGVLELIKQYCKELNVRYVHLLSDYLKYPFLQLAYKIPRFCEIEKIFVYVDKNSPNTETISILNEFKRNSQITTFAYNFKARKVSDNCCTTCDAICRKCAHAISSDRIKDVEYVCYAVRRIRSEKSTPFDNPAHYPICSFMLRQDHNCLQTYTTQNCPYYVEHYLQSLKCRQPVYEH